MRIILWTALAAFLADQASKYAVVHGMQLWRVREIDVLPPLLTFRYGENRGINFGLFADGSEASRWVLVALALVISLGVLVWAARQTLGALACVSAGLLVGGAVGNVVDRLYYGYVLDFLNMSCCGINNPFVFNVADIFIFAGAIGLVLFVKEPAEPVETGKKGE